VAHDHLVPGHASARAGARYKGRLRVVLALLAVFMVVEAVAGVLTRSLALISDAGHMLTDVVGVTMALAAIHLADRAQQRRHRTFGLYRLEILAALANALLLLGVATYVLVEAIRRFAQPAEVLGTPMLVVGVLGLCANLLAFALLREGARHSLNVQGAFLEVLADTLSSMGVILAAVILQLTGWTWVDPAIALGIGLFILPRTWRLGRQAVRILVQAAPPHIDLDGLQSRLAGIEGVVDVHDLHVWTLTSDMHVASAHLMVRRGTNTHSVLDQARDALRGGYAIDHATFQVEPDDHRGCDEVSW
jgi:cobalt-zinc-cadmium efflux system protein